MPLVIGFFAEYCLGPSLPSHFNLIGSLLLDFKCKFQFEELSYHIDDLNRSSVTWKSIYELPSCVNPAADMYDAWVLLCIIENAVGNVAIIEQ